jgi:hypothetical protein
MCKLYSSIKCISSDIIDDASHASLPPDKALYGWVTFIIQFYPGINAVTLVVQSLSQMQNEIIE